MAISLPHYRALKQLRDNGDLPKGGTILEIGEANVYDEATVAAAFGKVKVRPENNEWILFDLAKGIYWKLFSPSDVVSIDLHGTPDAKKHDLNKPIYGWWDEHHQYDVVINHGTAEHIFNVANVFRIMHENCKVGGLMIHESPCTGWVDHGFYTLQPTLFFDLAAANDYEVRYMAIEHIESNTLLPFGSREEFHQLARDGKLPMNAMLFVAMRKTSDADFKIPQQQIYSENVSESTVEAWHSLR